MEPTLFDDAPPVETTPAQTQKLLAKRETDRLRQKRHRAKNRDSAPKIVTAPPVASLFDADSPAAQTLTPELHLLALALSRLAARGETANRATILRALDQCAREQGAQIFNAARYLDGAIERGALPRLDSIEWVSIPRDLLNQLLA